MIGNLPKFLIIRFAPGAAGNMLASFLQCSPEVAHWNEHQQLLKPNNNWLEYFQHVFPNNVNRWLYHEPVGQLNWGTREIFSAKYPRGNNLSAEEFLKLENIHCNDYYHKQKKIGRWLPVFWHKEIMPEYFQHGRSLTVKIDPASVRWFDHAVYQKHHQIIDNNHSIKVRLLEHRPEIVPKNFRDDAQFEQTWDSFRQFVKERIVDNPFRKQYQQPDLMPAWQIKGTVINLSDLLIVDNFYQTYIKICQHFEITPILKKDEVTSLHSYWRNLHAI